MIQNDTMQERIVRNNSSIGDSWYLEPEIVDLYKFIKASKRGNDVYKHLVTEKLKQFDDIPNLIFFDEHTTDKRTNILFVTLTYDNSRCSHSEAWDNIGKEFHLFHNNLRKQFGKVEVFRTWESTGKYYPHVHAIIIFWDYDFPVFARPRKKDGEIRYRVASKELKKISNYWHSFIDVQGVEDTKGAINELTKYITKDLCSKKGDVTNAMIWYHRKQGYAISKGFAEAINGWNLDFNEPTNSDLINQMCNCNQQNINWEFVGILRGKHLGFSGNIWSIDIKKPPPRIVDKLVVEYYRWRGLNGGR